MNSYMVVATFKEDVTPEDIRALIPAEQVQAKLLEEQGLLGSIKVAMPKRTVFLEAFGVLETIHSLPLAALWDIEVFPTTPPAGSSV
jgi:phosphoribosyl-dephospho-CoA transferase